MEELSPPRSLYWCDKIQNHVIDGEFNVPGVRGWAVTLKSCGGAFPRGKISKCRELLGTKVNTLKRKVTAPWSRKYF
jgi:hypothetical protein